MPFSFFMWLAQTFPPHLIETALTMGLVSAVIALWREVTRYA